MLSLVRIDDRLVHGQVVEGWIPHLHAEVVVVASDSAAEDPTQIALMGMALPEKIELFVLPVAQAARHPALAPGYAKRVLLLAPGPREALALVESGAVFSRVNVGGLHYSAGRVQLGKAIFLDEQDLEALKKLSKLGVRLEGRALPGEKETDLLGLIETGVGTA
jgi:PTS system mannose-specific IIB component